MKIFDKRPLSLILCIMLGGFVFFANSSSDVRTLICVSLVALFLLSFIQPIGDFLHNNFGRLAIILLALSMLASYLYFDLWFYPSNRFDGEVVIKGTVINMSTENSIADLDIDVDNINDAPLSSYKLKAYVNMNDYYNYSIGSCVEIRGEIEDFELSDNGFNSKNYYTANAFSGVITEISDIKIISSGNIPFSYKISSFRESITRKIILNTDTAAGGFLSAVLLGDKTYLPSQTQLDFSRIGISHILALSGMHLAILIIGIGSLLSKFGINKKLVHIIMVILTVIYMTLTGFSVSVVRAGIMLIITSLLSLLSQTHDSVTSLFISVFLICISEPYAIYDLSLWLSAFATLGVIISSEYTKISETKPNWRTKFKNAILISIFAMSATLFITVNNFDGISIIAPISTLIFSLLTEVYLYVGILIVILSYIFPVGNIAVLFGNFIINTASEISDIEFIYVSTDFYAIKFLVIIFSIIFLSFFVFNIKKKKVLASVICLMFTSILIISSILTFIAQSKESFIYDRNDKQEQLTITSNGGIYVIDIATYDTSSAYETINSLKEKKHVRIDKYVIVKYSYDLSDALELLASNYDIDKIYLPSPKNQTELSIYNSIIDRFENYRAEVTLYEMRKAISMGEFSFFPVYSGTLTEDGYKNMFTVLYDDNFYTYLSTPMLKGETKSLALEIIYGSHTIVFGENGSEDYKFTYKIESAERIVFSSEKIQMHSDTYKYYKDIETYFIPETVDFIR